MVRHRSVKRGVSLRLDVVASLPRVACEAPLFEQALVNLLLNACDASTEGGEVSVSVRPESDRVVFEICDDGPGMSADEAARAAEPFFARRRWTRRWPMRAHTSRGCS